ncbi:MAG TPA: hypothetical protein VMV72_15565 [Verrucomicrobiae bacterium]|nr:hypothetical protein [Verrucomicrobiae bacterium]
MSHQPFRVRRRSPDRAEPQMSCGVGRPPHNGGGRQSESGVALILTLAILALVTLLLIAFVGSMRVENTASKNFNELVKARELARAGVDDAVGAIRMAAPAGWSSASTLTNYVTAPGVIYTEVNGTWTSNLLYTSVNTVDPNPLQAKVVDLNTNVNPITGIVSGTYNANAAPITAGWSNVTTTVNGVNQLVGRYAYWVDDESAKVDVNVAGARTTDLQGYMPDAIDLPTLGLPSALTTYVQGTRPLATIESMMMATPGVSVSTFANNQFYMTTYATSPDVTPWGAPQVWLDSNNLGISGSTPTMAQKQNAVNTIAAALQDSKLKTWYGKTFADKYPSVQQIAANIVDYISADNTPTDSSTSPTDTTQPAYLGLKETPYLNQLAIANVFSIADSGALSNGLEYGTLTISTTASAQLWYLYNNAPTWTVTAKNGPWVFFAGAPSVSLQGGGGINQTVNFNPATISTVGPGAIKSMSASTWQLPFITSPAQSIFVPDVTVPVVVSPGSGPITAIFSSPQGRMDWAQANVPVSKAKVTVTLGSAGTLTWALQCTDPRIKPSLSGNWSTIPASQLGNQTLPSVSAMSQGNGTIIGDGDPSCHTVSVSPLPNTGTSGRQRGAMYPSELAYIHTGIPWRTFFLEPEPSQEVGAGMIPDWVVVDLFTSASNGVATGRMNINSQINTAAGIPSTYQRLGPLEALFGSTSTTEPQDIYNYNVHNTPVPTTAKFAPSSLRVFTTDGQVCEVSGLADAGYVGGYGSAAKATRELAAQQVLNIVTTKSDTFTIWCIAQSVKKVDKTSANLAYFTPGVDVVTGEAKVQAIVERTVDYSTATPQVKFHTLYYRYYYQ